MPLPAIWSLADNLAMAIVMVALTVLMHFVGFIGLTRLMRHGKARFGHHETMARQAMIILVVIFGIFALHTVEIWSYAALYCALGEGRTFERALYFSTVTFSSIGYGDVVLSPKWRVLSAIEGANGVILFAWSTSFLITVTSRLRLLEQSWLE